MHRLTDIDSDGAEIVVIDFHVRWCAGDMEHVCSSEGIIEVWALPAPIETCSITLGSVNEWKMIDAASAGNAWHRALASSFVIRRDLAAADTGGGMHDASCRS